MAHHGICIPLSALHSKNSCGIGEFFDLLLLIDWVKSVGFDCIQLLPLNDTGNDPSPYNALSSCALDPVYLSLHGMGPIDLFQSLKTLPKVAFQEVKREKLRWLRVYFEEVFPRVSKTSQFQEFIERHKSWLLPYALFKTFKDELGGKYWAEWPEAMRDPKTAPQKNVDFHLFTQYLCFEQMTRVKAHADSQGVLLKGDVPILVSPDSADVWAERELFSLDLVAGAPPDLYNKLGQKWGFPLFNWDVMRKQKFGWWQRRLRIAEQFFHIYRIDHVVGLFRIWAIEKDKKPAQGFFLPKDPSLWPAHGTEILEKFLKATSMIPIAEDLGVIPKEVPVILKQLGIAGTKVVRWQRHWEGDRSFIPYEEYEPLSLTTVSTPDMATLPLWWKTMPEEASLFAQFKHWPYKEELNHEQLLELLSDAHSTPSRFHINLLQEYLRLFPELSWPNLEEDRINIPGTLLPTNWTFRLRPSIEELAAHEKLTGTMRKIALRAIK